MEQIMRDHGILEDYIQNMKQTAATWAKACEGFQHCLSRGFWPGEVRCRSYLNEPDWLYSMTKEGDAVVVHRNFDVYGEGDFCGYCGFANTQNGENFRAGFNCGGCGSN